MKLTSLLLTFLFLLKVIRSDCGTLKLINEEQTIFPSKTISGSFNTTLQNQYTVYMWVKLTDGMEAKEYTLFKMALSDTQFEQTQSPSQNNTSIYSEIFKISWNASTDVLNLQYPGGEQLSNAQIQPFENAFNLSANWRFIAFAFDFDKAVGKFFVKSYDDLNEILIDLSVPNFTNFSSKKFYKFILGGDGIDSNKNFNGAFSNVSFLNAYYEYLNYSYLMNQSIKAINSQGIILGSGMTPNVSGNLHTFGLSKNSNQTISTELSDKLKSSNTNDIFFSTGESVTFKDVDVSTLDGSVINSLYFNLDFSFSGEFPVDFNIVDIGNFAEPNSIRISMVEENSELAVKEYSNERVVLLDSTTELPTYVYNSSLKNPRVLKISIRTSKNQIFTFLAKEQLKEGERYRVIFGVIYHFPEVIRIYYGNQELNISLTSEIFGLPFNLAKSDVSLFANNTNTTGGKFKLNSFSIADSFFDFFLTNKYNDSYMQTCYQNTSIFSYYLDGGSKSLLDINSQNFSRVISDTNETFSLFCDGSKGFFMIEGKCLKTCLPGFYFNDSLEECKQCSTSDCSTEITAYSYNLSQQSDQDSSDKFITLNVSSSEKIYEVPLDMSNSSSSNVFVENNYANIANIPLIVSSNSLEPEKDFKYKILKSEIKDGLYNSQVEIEFLNPPEDKNTTFQISPNMPSAPEGKFYATSNGNPLKIEGAGIDIDTSSIQNCSSGVTVGKILAIIYLVFYFLLVIFFIVSNFLVYSNYLKWRLLIATIGSHLIAFCFLAQLDIGQLSFTFAEIIYKVLLKWLGSLSSTIDNNDKIALGLIYKHFVSNLNLLLLVGLLIILILIAFFILAKVKTMKGIFKPLYYKATHEWTLLASYLFVVPITVYSIIQFTNNDFGNGLFGTSFVIAIISLLLVLVAIAFGFLKVFKPKNVLYDPLYQYQNGFIYSPFKQKIPQMLVLLLSVVIFFIASILIGVDFEQSSFKLGVWGLFILSLIYLALLAALMPFRTLLINILEIICAFVLMLAFMFLLISLYYKNDVRSCKGIGFFFDIMFPILALIFILASLSAALIYFMKNREKKVLYQDGENYEAYRLKFNKVGEIDHTHLLFMKNGEALTSKANIGTNITSKELLLGNKTETIGMKNKTSTINKEVVVNKQELINDITNEKDNNKKMQQSLNKQEIILNNESRKIKDKQSNSAIFKTGSFGQQNLNEIPETKSLHNNQVTKRNTFGINIDDLKEENMIKINENIKTFGIKQAIDDDDPQMYMQPDEDYYTNNHSSYYNSAKLRSDNYSSNGVKPAEDSDGEYIRSVNYETNVENNKYITNLQNANYGTNVENINYNNTNLQNINYHRNLDFEQQRNMMLKDSFERKLEDSEYDRIKQKVLESRLNFESDNSLIFKQSDNNSSYIGNQYNVNNIEDGYIQGRLTNKYGQENANINTNEDFDNNSYRKIRKKQKLDFSDNGSYYINR